MSLVFSDTTGKNGVIQIIERNCGFNDGDITGSTLLMAQTTGDVNLAIDRILGFMFPINGPWQIDDSNQTKWPIIYTDIVSGRRDYAFTTDEQGNVILDIFKVLALQSATGTQYKELDPVDQSQQNDNNTDVSSMVNGLNLTGVPTRYSKKGNGIFLDLIPNYNATNGLKLLIDREATYFTVNDTTKKLGFAHLFHEYLAIYASHKYASRNSLAIAGGTLRGGARTGLLGDLYDMENAMKAYFGSREKDVRSGMRPNVESTR